MGEEGPCFWREENILVLLATPFSQWCVTPGKRQLAFNSLHTMNSPSLHIAGAMGNRASQVRGFLSGPKQNETGQSGGLFAG